MKLTELQLNEEFVIKKVLVKGEIGKRIVDMGLIKGGKGTVIRRAPLGEPIQVHVLGYDITLRRAEAEGIEVDRITEHPGA